MLRIILTTIFFLLCWVGIAGAAPFLTADSYLASTEVDQFVIYLDSGASIISSAKVNMDGTRSLWFDLSSVAPGQHVVKIRARASVWNLESADSDPFTFTKPSSPAKPAGLKLSP